MKSKVITGIAVLVVIIAAAALVLHLTGRKNLNVLLICVDTLRHDRLGYIGYNRRTSPNMDSLAAEGVVFRRSYSNTGWTLPSMATILTGRYPKDHGAKDFHLAMDRTLPTMAGILRRRGYDTRAYVSHVLLTRKYGFDKGFDHFDSSILEVGDPHKIATSRELTDMAIAGLRDAGEPFFMWVHYFDPHFRYLAHDEWSRFGDSDPDRYDQEIAFTDHHIGRLLGALKESGMYERTIIIFTSDHGEEFGEHGGEYHYTCFEEVLRTPLVVRAPFLNPDTSDALVEQIDFLPTILEMLGLEPPAGLPGRSMFAVHDDRALFAERDRPPGFKQRAVTYGDYKIIHIENVDRRTLPPQSRMAFSQPRNVHPGTYMFNLRDDPGEKKDIFSPDNAIAQRILYMLAAYSTGAEIPGEEIGVSEEMKEKLRSLGYID